MRGRGSLEERARQARGRLALRAWEYRQRDHAKGVWFELRRLLAGAARACTIGAEDAADLLAEGYLPQPVGARLAPAKLILVVSGERVQELRSAREVPVRLGMELLGATHLVLVPFE